MPTTPRGLEYPDSTGSTNTWEHWEALAESADTAIGAAAASTLNDAEESAAELYGKVAHLARYKNAAQSLASGVAERILFNLTEVDDEGIAWGTASGFAVVQEAGLYLLNTCVTFDAATGTRTVVVRLNDTARAFVRSPATSAADLAISVSKSIRCEAGDALSVEGLSSNSVAIIFNASRSTTLDITRIGN